MPMLEKFSLVQLQHHALVPNLPEDRLVKLLKSLNETFTQSRSLDNYILNRELISAYSCFYLPTNLPKYQFILAQLSVEVRRQLQEVVFIDYACGPGTFALAHLSYFQNASVPAIYLVDQSPLMLEQAGKYLQHFFPDYHKLYFQSQLNFMPEHRFETVKKCLFFGHSINEMSSDAALEIIGQVKPEFIFFIEIGQRSFFAQALALRQALTAAQYHLWYPCLDSMQACPLAVGQNNWCHQVMKTTHPADLERLSQLLQLDRRSMPLISHFYQQRASININIASKITTAKDLYSARIFRIFPPSKFALHWEVCLCDHQYQDRQVIIKLEFPKKLHTREQLKNLMKLMAGQQISFLREKILAVGHWRAIASNIQGDSGWVI